MGQSEQLTILNSFFAIPYCGQSQSNSATQMLSVFKYVTIVHVAITSMTLGLIV